MSRIILTTLNARYIHASLGLRYLYSNMGTLQADTELIEFVIDARAIDIAEQLLAKSPKIIGLGVYIWNIEQTTHLVGILKSLQPDLIIVLGGPEVSYEPERQDIVGMSDYVISGTADKRFAELCGEILNNEAPTQKLLGAIPFELNSLASPYPHYSDVDVAQRVIYVEASRGCPFKCEFCLSALDKTAWPFDLEAFLEQMEMLYQRGTRHFKFVDRTFNLKIKTSLQILEFFLEKLKHEQLFLHFELIPDHLPESLKSAILRFPEGSLQFEIGIQTFTPDVQARISRKQDNVKSKENIRWLRDHSSAHLHTDLIAGLPGETLASFADSFDQLAELNPHEIQVGILKRLRGSPIIRHTEAFELKFNPLPPYNILQTNSISFTDMQRLNRFARYWDMIANSGRFSATKPLILGDAPFERFMQLSDWIFAQTNQTHKISLPRLFGLLHQGCHEALSCDTKTLEAQLLEDFNCSGIKGRPTFLPNDQQRANKSKSQHANRQQRHR